MPPLRNPARLASFLALALTLLMLLVAPVAHAIGTLTTTATVPSVREPAASVSSAEIADTLISAHTAHEHAPALIWILPFVLLLLSIAILPLIPRTSHWWEHNRNKLLIAGLLAALTAVHYITRPFGFHETAPGWATLGTVLHHAIVGDYIPFMVLLFSLYTISGGIRVSGDIPARPLTNTLMLALGALMASFIGTTGASMLLIRPLLQINSERRHVVHTVVFFIFLVSNIGGSLLPIGDPPLFLGYLRGVPFLWTLHLFPLWATALAILLTVYFIFDSVMHRREPKEALGLDETRIVAFKLEGARNLWLLLGVVLAVGILLPKRPLLGTSFVLPNIYLREIVQLMLAALSMAWTARSIRQENHFNFSAIGEVAALFIGIFITMQIPIEILQAQGAALGVNRPLEFFWASGALSSFLDNAPTYVVFFELAGAITRPGVAVVSGLQTATGMISQSMLLAIAAGSVFMGANTYIGNGPNFLVKSIAESRGVKMPSFFGYMVYSGLILLPTFALLTVIFFRG